MLPLALYRDLKAKSIQVSKDNSTNTVIAKVSNFRLAHERDCEPLILSVAIKWTAPEALNFGVSADSMSSFHFVASPVAMYPSQSCTFSNPVNIRGLCTNVHDIVRSVCMICMGCCSLPCTVHLFH